MTREAHDDDSDRDQQSPNVAMPGKYDSEAYVHYIPIALTSWISMS